MEAFGNGIFGDIGRYKADREDIAWTGRTMDSYCVCLTIFVQGNQYTCICAQPLALFVYDAVHVK